MEGLEHPGGGLFLPFVGEKLLVFGVKSGEFVCQQLLLQRWKEGFYDAWILLSEFFLLPGVDGFDDFAQHFYGLQAVEHVAFFDGCFVEEARGESLLVFEKRQPSVQNLLTKFVGVRVHTHLHGQGLPVHYRPLEPLNDP